jgi:hypothetical protein
MRFDLNENRLRIRIHPMCISLVFPVLPLANSTVKVSSSFRGVGFNRALILWLMVRTMVKSIEAYKLLGRHVLVTTVGFLYVIVLMNLLPPP